MNEVHVGDEVDFIEFKKYRSKGTVTEITVLNNYYCKNEPCVCVYESWGNDHAPGSTCGHNFCFLRRYNGSWEDLGADAKLDPKYYEYLDRLFGIDSQR